MVVLVWSQNDAVDIQQKVNQKPYVSVYRLSNNLQNLSTRYIKYRRSARHGKANGQNEEPVDFPAEFPGDHTCP